MCQRKKKKKLAPLNTLKVRKTNNTKRKQNAYNYAHKQTQTCPKSAGNARKTRTKMLITRPKCPKCPKYAQNVHKNVPNTLKT